MKKAISWRDYDIFKDRKELFGATFHRHGGSSGGAFTSLNVSNSVGDHPQYVKSNREKIRKASGMWELVFLKQVHGDRIIEITKDNFGEAFVADGMFTMEKGLGLAIAHADCQAALFYDPVKGAIAAVHAGWRGQMQNIYAKTVAFFKERSGSRPSDILVSISPSLGPDHAYFPNYREEFPEEYWSYKKENDHFDLWQLSRMQLVVAGVREKNIEIAGICTFCNSNDYYSFRKEKLTGRNATVIGLAL